MSKTHNHEDSSASVPTKNNIFSQEQIQTVKIPLTVYDSTLANNGPRYMIFAMEKSFYGQKEAITIAFKSGERKNSLIAKIAENFANFSHLAAML